MYIYDGPVIDIHAHLAATADDLVNDRHSVGAAALAKAVGVDRVAHATAIVIAGRGDPVRTAAANDASLVAAGETDGFLIPVVSVHPHDGATALAELDRVAAAGARVLKLHPNTQAVDTADDAVAEVVARATEHNMVVLVDGWSPFDAQQPGKFVKLAMAIPDAKIILAHMNGPGFADLMVFHVLAKYSWWRRNVWFDLSATAPMLAGGPYAEQFRWVTRQLGADRVLYGSDWPLYDPAEALSAVRSLGFTEDEERQIFHDNAVRLLHLRP
jgi:predicted TIM-barrel fold metal-dependent hydrolase